MLFYFHTLFAIPLIICLGNIPLLAEIESPPSVASPFTAVCTQESARILLVYAAVSVSLVDFLRIPNFIFFSGFHYRSNISTCFLADLCEYRRQVNSWRGTAESKVRGINYYDG